MKDNPIIIALKAVAESDKRMNKYSREQRKELEGIARRMARGSGAKLTGELSPLG